MRTSHRRIVFASALLALFASSAVYAACNQQQAAQCRAVFTHCYRTTNGDPDGQCEVRYYRCLQGAGCQIP